jgi:chorismate synthase
VNSFGRNFRITTFGESHGKALGVVIDGCPPGIPLAAADIQPFLDRRRPGKSPLESPRKEPDRVELLSGVFQEKTTGAPIALIVENRDIREEDYQELEEIYRPGHADYTWQAKYGIRDHRGGGRSSGRETVARVAAGAVAAKILAGKGIKITGRILEIHGKRDPDGMNGEIEKARDEGDSVGGIAEVLVTGSPAGLGDPVFAKLDALLAHALMGIGAVKGVEIGEGFAAARMKGSKHNDAMTRAGFATNHAGGILGGISTGQEIVARIAVKPTPSIAKTQRTLDRRGNEVSVSIVGRHDPCIVPRILPVAEAMVALVMIDVFLEQAKYRDFPRESQGGG